MASGSILLQNRQLTLLELGRRTDPKGDLAVIAEVLSESNEFLMDAIWKEANGAFYNKTVKRVSLPKGTFRKINEGVDSEASQTTEVIDGIAMLESYAEADKALVDMAANPTQARNDEAKAFIEGLGQTFADTFVYGNANYEPEKFTGLAPRIASLGTMCVSAGNAGGTSAYIVEWGENACHLVYPKGHKSVGVERNDLGQVTAVDSTGKKHEVYRDHFKVAPGFVCKDDRALGRVANIAVTGSSNLLTAALLVKVINQLRSKGRNAVIYVNRTVKAQLDILAMDKSNVWYTEKDAFGNPVTMFRGVPVRMLDSILDNESTVS